MASASRSAWKSAIAPRSMSVSNVAGDDEEALVQLVAGVEDRPGGAERPLGGVHHPHAELGAVAEVVADVVGHEGHGDHDVVEAVPA